MCTHNVCFEQTYKIKKKYDEIFHFYSRKNNYISHGQYFIMDTFMLELGILGLSV